MRGFTSAGAPLPSTGILRNSFFREVQLGELVDWNVLLLGGNVADQVTLGTIGVNFVVRQPKGGYGNIAPYRVVEPGERFLISRLLNPRDGDVDIGADAYAAALAQTMAKTPNRRSESNEPPRRHTRTFRRTNWST